MTAWRLVPITNGYHILTRVFADQVLVGELTLRREDYGDLAARLGAPQAFDTATGRPLPVSSFGEPLWSPQVVQSVPDPVDRVEARLAAAVGWDLWEPNGPSPVDEAVRRLAAVDAQPDGPTPPSAGCAGCYPAAPTATTGAVSEADLDDEPLEAGERTDDLSAPPRTFPDPSYREPDGGGVA